MKKTTTLVIALLCSALFSSAQITWSKTLSPSFTWTIEECFDGSFIVAMDSSGPYVLHMDAYGNQLWVAMPQVRTSGESIYCAAPDLNGGYIVGGVSPDTTGTFDSEPFLLRLDENGNTIDYRFFPPGDVGGRTSGVRSTSDFGYLVGVFQDDFGGSNSSRIYKLASNMADQWDNGGSGSDIEQDAMLYDNNQRTLFGAFSVTGATLPTIQQFDPLGAYITNFSVPDTFSGGSLGFDPPAIVQGDDGNYLVGATISPNNGPYDYPYVSKLDNSMNPIWEKTLEWGQAANVTSIAPASGNGAMVMLNFDGDIYLYRIDQNGDSLWTRNFPGIGGASGWMMRRCMDGGYILGGQTNGNAYAIKVDSLGRILPPVDVQIAGSTPLCPNDVVTLTAPGGYLYRWSNGATTPSVQVGPGTYTVTVTSFTTSDSAISPDIIIAGVPVNTTITPNGPLDFCAGGNVQLSAPAGTNYNWSTTETSQDITADASGTYWTTYTDGNLCLVTTDSVVVNEFPAAQVPVVTAQGVTLQSTPAATYQWYKDGILLSDDTNQVITPLHTGNYTVVITDANGCEASSAPYYVFLVGLAHVSGNVSLFTCIMINQQLKIEMDKGTSGTLQITNSSGQLLYTNSIESKRGFQTIDISNFASGIYFVSFLSDSQMQTEKIIISE